MARTKIWKVMLAVLEPVSTDGARARAVRLEPLEAGPQSLRFTDRGDRTGTAAKRSPIGPLIRLRGASFAMQNIAVIGAGITGITTAFALKNRGFGVTVFDKNRYPAMETSFANGGQLSASNAEVWNSWSTVLKGCKWLLKSDAPLLVNPSPSWRKYSWFAEFLMNIRGYADNTTATARLAIAAREQLLRYAEAENISFDCEKRGILHFYDNRADFAHAVKVTELLRAGGLERRAVSPSEIRALEPALTGDFYGGFYTESDFTGDIHRFTRGLADACRRKNVVFNMERSVDDLRHGKDGVTVTSTPQGETEAEQDRFDGVVICGGVGSRDLAARVGDRVPVYPVKGYSITVNLRDEESRAAAPWVSLLDDKAKIVTSRLGADRFRVAGTAEFNGTNRDIRADRIRPLVGWCERLFPGMSTDSVVPWAGLRPMMPSMMPKVGAGRRPGVFYNTGHGHLGWTLSAATAELIADRVAA